MNADNYTSAHDSLSNLINNHKGQMDNGGSAAQTLIAETLKTNRSGIEEGNQELKYRVLESKSNLTGSTGQIITSGGHSLNNDHYSFRRQKWRQRVRSPMVHYPPTNAKEKNINADINLTYVYRRQEGGGDPVSRCKPVKI